MKPIKRVAVTGAAGQIAYSLLFWIASGAVFGKDQPVALHLLDLPIAENALKGIKMELDDCVYPLLKEVRLGSSAEELFEGVDFAFLVGAKPRTMGMERKDLLHDNGKIFVNQGKALNKVASRHVRVLVVGNPCNTNCLICMHHAPDIPKHHFFAMTRLDQNRAVYQLAQKLNVAVEEIAHMTIWGNHSNTQVPDFVNATVHGAPLLQVLKDRKWLEGEFTQLVQQRGTQIISVKGKSSSASAANAAADAMKSLLVETPHNQWFSSGIYSKGNPYGIDSDLVFSFPCRINGDKEIEIVPNLKSDPFLKEKVAITEKELKEERDLVRELLK